MKRVLAVAALIATSLVMPMYARQNKHVVNPEAKAAQKRAKARAKALKKAAKRQKQRNRQVAVR